ncbi:MAG: peptidoglycan-binding protein [Eubacterium sp.]|nr:peptidoglycan-binding protein [Eubacterium sp.]
MKRITRSLLAASLAGMMIFTPVASAGSQPARMVAQAHSGRTDSNGGHRDNRNASGLGSYHYHCGGYPAHLHENGVCPYTDSASSAAGSSASQGVGTSRRSAAVSSSTVKKVQKKLNRLGYECGTADGIMGSKSKKALKKFQRDHELQADGVIGKKTLKALGLD